MNTYRVSTVEAFRRWEKDEDAELEPLLAQIRGEGGGSEAMRAGTALHKALEDAQAGADFDTLSANGYTFHFDGDFSIALPTIRELRASKVYMVDGGPITISGQVDALHGRRIEDHKTTGHFNADRFMEGYQWRLYLEIFGADHFRWNVFEIAELDRSYHYTVRAQHTLEQWRYPALADDCQRLVERFARFACAHLDEREAA